MSPESDIFEQIKLYLPKYLTTDQREELYEDLKKFPDIPSYYLNNEELGQKLLQGDGWQGFIVIEFATGDRKTVSGVILSNSCDISPENVRALPVNVLFAPLIELQKYIDLLRASGKDHAQIGNIVDSVRKQRTNSIFYLPECPSSIRESLILLDDIHAHPLQDFLNRQPSSLFTLSQCFFYIFLIKLSIHFARFQEGVQRFTDAA